MNQRAIFLVALTAILTAVANLLLRAGVVRAGGFDLTLDRIWSGNRALASQPLFLVGVLCYGLAAVVWFSALSKANLSVAYPVLVGLTFVLVTVGSVAFLQEGLTWVGVMGMVLILAGVALVSGA